MFRRRNHVDEVPIDPEMSVSQRCNPQEDVQQLPQIRQVRQKQPQALQKQHPVGILKKRDGNCNIQTGGQHASRRSSISAAPSSGLNGSNHSDPKSSRSRRRRASLSAAMPLSTDPSSPFTATVTTLTSMKKRVSWNRRVEKKRHIRIQDLTAEEVQSVWYSEDDCKIILAMAKVTVKMMMKGEPCDDGVDFCSRGLEGKTSAGSKRRQRNKANVRRALLEEQQMQRDEGVFDPDFLAQVCLKHSRDIVAAAHAQGVRDEREIQSYLFSKGEDSSPLAPRRNLSRG